MSKSTNDTEHPNHFQTRKNKVHIFHPSVNEMRVFSCLSDPCPTFAAMLEGALDDSVRFVDDLSTLLDLDVQYKNPRNWQGLAQTLFNLSYNKIMEMR